MPNNYTDYFRRSLARELQHVEIDSLKGVIEGYPIVFNRPRTENNFTRKSTPTRSTRRIYRISNSW